MQKNKALFLFLSFAFIGRSIASEQKIKAPVASSSELLVLSGSEIAAIVGFVQIIRGSYGFFKSSDDSLTTKTLSDFERSELDSMTKEKLTKLIAREDERSKNTIAAFERVLSGILWISVARITQAYGTGFQRDFQNQQLKITPSAPAAPVTPAA
jgi:hypothetical protein